MIFSFINDQLVAGDFPLRHGFTGKALPLRKDRLEEDKKRFCERVGVEELILARQAHTSNFLFLTEDGDIPHQEADSIITPRSPALTRSTAIGVVTADCVPVLVVSDSYAAVIHAGWRGLAKGIIEQTLQTILEKEPDASFHVFIGPCAGPERYQVGSDVIEALSDRGVSETDPNDPQKFLLHLADTALNIIGNYPTRTAEWCGICTITDQRFYSYRRDQEKFGRNLSYLIL